ncbi:MAG: ABC transporter permease [Oscillospiraceae bacterium]|nr:ABC transporter permease [Oscillospiraceae bacterium]
MSAISPFQSCRLEFQKAKRKCTWLLFLALLGINLAYMFWSMKRADAGTLPFAWEQTLFCVPLVNTLFLSVVIAVLSSRTMDMEHKAGTWNLLQTLQSRPSIFLGKTLYGFVWVLLFGVLQGISILGIGKCLGFRGTMPIPKVLAVVCGEIVSGMLVYQIGCLLALLFSSQFAALSINLGGTLAGLFLMFVTDLPVTPWSLLVALRVVDMNYQEGDASASYEWFAAPTSSWIIAFLLFAAALIWGICLYAHMEEGTLSIFHDKRIRSADTHSSLPVEMIKLKRSPVWIAFFIIPIISAAIGTFNFLGNQGVLSFTWESLWTQHSLFLGVFFLPPLIGVLCSLLWRMEHTGTNWNLTLSLESPWKLVKDKLLAASGMSILCVLWIGILFVGCGVGIGLPSVLPTVFYECMLCGSISCVAISAVQIFLSLIIRSFAIPVGSAVVGSAVGIAFVVKGWIYALPYAMLQTGLKSTTLEWETNLGGFIMAAAAYIALFYLLSVLYLKRSDVKTLV